MLANLCVERNCTHQQMNPYRCLEQWFGFSFTPSFSLLFGNGVKGRRTALYKGEGVRWDVWGREHTLWLPDARGFHQSEPNQVPRSLQKVWGRCVCFSGIGFFPTWLQFYLIWICFSLIAVNFCDLWLNVLWYFCQREEKKDVTGVVALFKDF